MGEVEAVKSQFAKLFSDAGKTHVIRAPGRVNLIGEHTDYNDGFVFPMAIEPQVLLACRGREDGQVRLASAAFPGEFVEFTLQAPIHRGKPAWGDYFRGIAAEFLAAGIPLVGMDGLVAGTLRAGGLSSSAAVEVAFSLGLLTLAGLTMDAQRLAVICRKADNEFLGVPCGVMDQTIVAVAKAGHATLLDCRDLSNQFVPINPDDLSVVIVNSMFQRQLIEGQFAERQNQCQQGVAHFRKTDPAIRALRDVSLKQLEEAQGRLSEVIFRRCRHVITENARTTAAASELARHHYEQLGELMQESHASLRDDYEVSCAELDWIVENSMKIKGVYEARLTGAGFGGCAVAIVQPRAVEMYAAQIREGFSRQFSRKPQIFVTTAAAGASVLA